MRSVDAGRPELQPLPLILRNIGDFFVIVKNYALFILLFGLLGMAKSITDTLTEHENGFAGLKYVTFPRRAGLFFFCTQVQGTPKRPVENFIVDIQI